MSKRKPDGWVARDEVGMLNIHEGKPIRQEDVMENGTPNDYWVSTGEHFQEGSFGMEENDNRFKDLAWEDEPLPVAIISLKRLEELEAKEKTLEIINIEKELRQKHSTRTMPKV
jgi:hypothetical protein